ncbi:MAG TPA: circadian clock KaiB family protein [Afipia sp.]
MTDPGAEPWGEPAALHYQLRLYVTGATARSTRAIENLRRFCEDELAGLYDLEVIDIYQNPEAARDAQIIAAPTLIKMQPEPVRRIIGDMTDEDRVRRGLNLEPPPAEHFKGGDA